MLRIIDHLIGYRVDGTDGEVGTCRDFLFRDDDWSVTYLVVETGGWFSGRKFVLPPSAVERLDYATSTIRVSVSREEVKDGPTLEAHQPVSMEYERRYDEHFQWGLAAAALPGTPTPFTSSRPATRSASDGPTNHLRSIKEVSSYTVAATDGDFGNIESLILNDENWVIRYFTSNVRTDDGDRKVLVSTRWIKNIDWSQRRIVVDLSIAALRSSPPFDPETPINREYELRLYNFYGKPVDW